MDMGNKFSKLRVTFFALALALVNLPVSAVAEDEGCVACHAGPMALNGLLTERVANHPDVSMMVNTVPTDCAMCHAAGTDLGLMNIIHPRHEGMACDSCHAVDDSGAPASIKTGAKNW